MSQLTFYQNEQQYFYPQLFSDGQKIENPNPGEHYNAAKQHEPEA